MNIDILRDLSIVFVVIIIANILFNNFEKHLPVFKRVVKHGGLFIVIALVRIFLGETTFLVVLGILTLGQIILHAWWFPKNGINGLTAKPYDKYLELVTKRGQTTKKY